MRVVRDDLVQKAESGIRRDELKDILRELIQEEVLPAVQAQIKAQSDSELPRAAKYRRIIDGEGARTKTEKEEAAAVAKAVAGDPVGDFWSQFPGGRA
jgi:nicotinamide mononucleotide adenylyltransferase